MIFATVGTQLPFDRLLLGLDSWAATRPDIPVLAQTGASKREFRNIETVGQLSQAAFRARVSEARIVVAHAGMGTILTAAELGKPLIMMPRRARFGEHRNDHQRDTAEEMSRLSNVTVVRNGMELHTMLNTVLAPDFESDCRRDFAAVMAAEPLLDFVRGFVWNRPMATGPARTSQTKDAA